MTISGSLSNALSGLTAASRAAEVVSANVANAMTDGYARREVELSSRSVGGTGAGVQVEGVSRIVDKIVLADRRLADAQAAGDDIAATFYAGLEDAFGTPDDPGSLGGRIAEFESSLALAAARPDSDARLLGLADAARGVAAQLNTVSQEIQTARISADSEIAHQVDLLNDRLNKIADLNSQISSHHTQGHDAVALMDQRQALVDDIASIIPVRIIEREFGQIALYTPTGASLIEGTAATFSFEKTGTIVPEMTLASGALSGLTLNGQPIETSGRYSPVAGGSLAALFQQRDTLAPGAQAELDAVTRDLIERFQDSGIDSTLSSGDAGLFTDGGAPFAAASEIGISARISVNTAIDGAEWRLRDGLAATAPGLAGDNALINAMAGALTETRTPASGSLAGADRSAAALSAELLSWVSTHRQSAEADQAFSRTKADTLKSAELSGGVDTDAELQNLLVIERSYAANARVIQAVDDLIQSLLSI